MNVLCVGKRFAIHIEDTHIDFRPLCGKEVDRFFITRVKEVGNDVHIRCPKCRKIWKEMNNDKNT